VPDKALFLILLGAWCVLFQFFGISSFNFATDTPSLLQWMYNAWNTAAMDSSQGNLIPFVVAVLLWVKRRELAESIRGPWWPGLVLVGLALLVHILGFLAQQPRVSMIGFFAGIYALVGLVWGWKTMKVSFFPFVLFAFCMPFGAFFNPVTLPLRLLATKWTAAVCRGVLDINMVAQGTLLIGLRGKTYDVAAACSGIRSFVALLAITTIFSVLTFNSIWRRAIMIALTVPLVLVSNTIRLVAIVLASQAFGDKAGWLVHEWFWIVTYSLALGGLLLAAHWLKEKPAPA
jgi:exosortase